MPTRSISTANNHINWGYSEKEKLIFFSESWLKYGSNNCAISWANIAEKILSTNDSVKNWKINCFLRLPITFLIPISLALPAERPIASVVKLMQAINNIPTAILNNIQMYFESIPVSPPAFILKFLCISGNGCNRKLTGNTAFPFHIPSFLNSVFSSGKYFCLNCANLLRSFASLLLLLSRI